VTYEPTLQNFQKYGGDLALERLLEAVAKPIEENYHQRVWSAGEMRLAPAASPALLAGRAESILVLNPDAGATHHAAAGRCRVRDDWQSGFLGLVFRCAPADGGAGDASFPITLSVEADGDDHTGAADLTLTETVTMPGVAGEIFVVETASELEFLGSYQIVTWSIGRESDTYAGGIHLLTCRLTFRPKEIQH